MTNLDNSLIKPFDPLDAVSAAIPRILRTSPALSRFELPSVEPFVLGVPLSNSRAA